MDYNVAEGLFAGVFKTGENHSGNPEGDYVIAGDKHVGGIEILKFGSFFRPAQGAEGPKGGAEPGIEGIGVLVNVFAVAVLTLMRLAVYAKRFFAAVVAVPDGDSVTPPKLTADAPVADVFHPVEIVFVKTLRHKADIAVFNGFDCRLGKLFHGNEPLEGNSRLHGGVAAIAGADVVLVLLYANKIAALFKVFYDGFAGVVSVHSGVFGIIVNDFCVVGENVDNGKIVAQTHLEVVGVVGGSDFYNAGAEFHIYIFIGNNRDFSAYKGQNEGFADVLSVTLVLGVYRNGGIAEERFRAGGGKLKPAGAVGKGIAQVPEVTRLILVLNLRVGDGGFAAGAPVYNAFAAINKTLFVKVGKHLANSLAAALVKGEAFSVPVAGAAELFELTDNGSAVFFFPVPCSFKEAVAPDGLFGKTLGTHIFHDFDLGGDGSVIGSGKPKGFVALHTLHTDNNVLNGFIHGVTHMKLAGDVWRGNDYGERLFIRVYLCVEVTAVKPKLINAAFHLRRVVGFIEFFAHNSASFPEYLHIHLNYTLLLKQVQHKIAKKRKKLAVKTYYCLCEGLRYRIKKGLEKLKRRTAGFVLYFFRGRVKYRFGYSGDQSFPQKIYAVLV